MPTNALVLDYLLQPESNAVIMQQTLEEPGTYAEQLLAMIARMEPPVRVILDVGAQILELDNIGVAYVSTGMMPENSAAHMTAFETLSTTSAAAYLDLTKCASKLTVSLDFTRTVEVDLGYPPIVTIDQCNGS